jgi:glycosyltransferase involved in cell wall biosynthesis
MGQVETRTTNLPKVSIIVSFLNSARTIENCLFNILHQDYPSDSFDVFVVDGGSTDGSAEICKRLSAQFKNLRLMVLPGCSEPEGQIAAIAASKGDVIMFTNSDIYVPRNWVRMHVHWLEKGFDLVGGRVFWGGDKFAFTWNVPSPDKPQYEQQPGMGLGFSNCSVRRNDLIAVGGLATLQSQHDSEFALRMVKQGRRLILDPVIEVYHDHPMRSLQGSFRRSYGYARNHVIVARTIYGRPVPGSSRTTRAFLSSAFKELAMVNSRTVYHEKYPSARAHKIEVSLFEFMFIRLFSTKLGQACGIFAGALKRGVTNASLRDLHGPGGNGREALSVEIRVEA